MTLNTILANRLREVFLNGTWIANTNYKDQLEKISWTQAIQKVEDLNTIAALTFHVDYYINGLLKAFETGKLEIHDKYSFDLPPINNEADWNKLMNSLLSNAEKFANTVEQMQDTTFEKPFIDEKYGTYYRNIEAQIEHSYYHLGQISLIRKMINNKNSST